MKARIYSILEIIFILLFMFSAYKLYTIFMDYETGDEIYEESVNEFIIPKETDTTSDDSTGKNEFDFTVDFEGLKETNDETLGWICIPDTEVNYPLLQTHDNNYYLKHTYNHTYSNFGSIFLDYRCNSDLTDRNTIIYGHNTKNGSMFGSLKKYKDTEYLNEHPYIYIIYEDCTYKFQIFTAFTTTTSSDVYQLGFETARDYRAWITAVQNASEVDVDIYKPTGKEKIITLSTCTSRTETERFVVLAIQISPESPAMGVAKAADLEDVTASSEDLATVENLVE